MKISTAHTYNTKPRYQKSTRRASKMFLRLKDKTEVMENCGDAALILYEFYISKAGAPNYAFTDAQASDALNWNIHKIQQNRLKLTKHDYFKQVNGKLNDGRRVTVTYLEPELIREINSLANDPELLLKLLEMDKEIDREGGC